MTTTVKNHSDEHIENHRDERRTHQKICSDEHDKKPQRRPQQKITVVTTEKIHIDEHIKNMEREHEYFHDRLAKKR